MQVYKTKGFARFARRERIEDEALCEAVVRAGPSLLDADLASGVIKQRVARPGQGRSGGFRTIVLFRAAKRAVLVDGFAKSDQANIDDADLTMFRELASEFLRYSREQVGRLVEAGAWIEVNCDD